MHPQTEATSAAEQSEARREIERLRREVEQLRLSTSPDTRGLLETVLRHSPHGIAVCDRYGRMRLRNSAVERIWSGSVTVDDLASWDQYRGFHPDGRPYAVEDWPMARCLANSTVVEAEEVRFQRFDDSLGVLLVSSAPIFDTDGRLDGAVAVFADITRLKQAEEERRLLTEQLSQQIAATQKGAARISTLYAITSALSRTLTIEEVGEALIGLVHDNLAAKASVVYFCGEENGPLVLSAHRGLAGDMDTRLKHLPRDARRPLNDAIRTGEALWFETREELLAAYPHMLESPMPSDSVQATVAIPLRGTAGVIGGLGFSFGEARRFDESKREYLQTVASQCVHAVERAQLLAAERRSRRKSTLLYQLTNAISRAEHLDEVFDLTVNGICDSLGADRASILLFDPDGVMRFKGWRGLSDRYRAAVEGHTPWRPDTKDPAPVLVAEVLADEDMRDYRPVFEAEGIRALGFFPLLSESRVIGKFMVYYGEAHVFTEEDLDTGRAIAEQVAFAVERNVARDERERFLGIVGHDLRNPLSAIAMGAASLLRRELPESGARTVRRIATAADRMDRLIKQLLTFAQARHGRGIPLVYTDVALADLAHEVIDELEAAAPGSQVRLHLNGPVSGRWDRDRLAEVLSNLVGNAIQHGDGKGVDVRLRQDGAEVLVEVHNFGAPIAADLLPRLFDPFRRGATPETSTHSVGLGLYISRELVRAHRGEIDVSSRAGEGTTFLVRLPVQPQA